MFNFVENKEFGTGYLENNHIESFTFSVSGSVLDRLYQDFLTYY